MVFFVAEIGSNWEGDVKKGYQLIKECKEAGADAVKFQMWRAKDLYDWKFKKYELTPAKAVKLKMYADEIGIEFFCSVFYPEAVKVLETLGVKRYKIASRTFTKKDPHWLETIKTVIKTRKPMIVSNGFTETTGVGLTADNYVKQLYCISEYPAYEKDIDWDEIVKYDGFSDHTRSIGASLEYCRLCPNGILEKHIRLKDSKSPDAHFSITTQELAHLITLVTSSSDIPA